MSNLYHFVIFISPSEYIKIVLFSILYDHFPAFVWHIFRGRCGRDRMVVGFTTIFAITAYRH
jgi:hypothetical protein